MGLEVIQSHLRASYYVKRQKKRRGEGGVEHKTLQFIWLAAPFWKAACLRGLPLAVRVLDSHWPQWVEGQKGSFPSAHIACVHVVGEAGLLVWSHQEALHHSFVFLQVTVIISDTQRLEIPKFISKPSHRIASKFSCQHGFSKARALVTWAHGDYC